MSGRTGPTEMAEADRDRWRDGELIPVVGRRMVVGRASAADIRVPDPLVSRSHAEILRRADGGLAVIDLKSSNGTFVNGTSIASQHLRTGDIVSVGSWAFRVQPTGLEIIHPARGGALVAHELSVAIKGQRLLADVSFVAESSSMVAIVGPTGAGKSTLVKSMMGEIRPEHGDARFRGRSLADSADLQEQVGYVPQEDLLHRQLRLGTALEYAGELRFADDLEPSARRGRVNEVMHELGLSDRANLPIAKLSGGQRKRASIAVELLTRPPLIFLDEPTSGLDPAMELQVTVLLRDLARAGHIVVVVTHALHTLHEFDRVLFLARGGRMAFYGPPAEARAYFARQSLGTTDADVFRRLDDVTTPWDALFKGDRAFDEYVRGPAARVAASSASPTVTRSRRHPSGRHLRTLIRRQLSILAADRRAVLLLILQAPAFGILFTQLYSSNVLATAYASEATILMWLIVVGITWIGTSNSIREVVGERAVIERETKLGVSPGAYLGAKAAVFGVLVAFQALVLVAVALLPQRLPAEDPLSGYVFRPAGAVLPAMFPELVVDVAAAGLAAMALGLLLSALVRTADQAMVLLPIVLVAQIVLSAPLFGPPGPVLGVLGLASSAHWGTAAVAASIELNEIRRPFLGLLEDQRAAAEQRPIDESAASGRALWMGTGSAWATAIGALAVLTAWCLTAAYAVLRRRPETRRGPPPLARALP